VRYLVFTESRVHHGREVLALSMIRLELGKPPLALVADLRGAEVLLQQFPMPTARPRTTGRPNDVTVD